MKTNKNCKKKLFFKYKIFNFYLLLCFLIFSKFFPFESLAQERAANKDAELLQYSLVKGRVMAFPSGMSYPQLWSHADALCGPDWVAIASSPIMNSMFHVTCALRMEIGQAFDGTTVVLMRGLESYMVPHQGRSLAASICETRLPGFTAFGFSPVHPEIVDQTGADRLFSVACAPIHWQLILPQQFQQTNVQFSTHAHNVSSGTNHFIGSTFLEQMTMNLLDQTQVLHENTGTLNFSLLSDLKIHWTALLQAPKEYLDQFTTLDFTQIIIEPQEVEIFSNILRRMPNLKNLILSGSLIKDYSSLLILAESLFSVKQLELLDLSKNGNNFKIFEIIQFLFSVPQLKTLKMNETFIDLENFEVFISILSQLRKLESLHLRGTFASVIESNNNFIKIINTIKSLPLLRKLDFSDHELSSKEVSIFLEALSQMPQLERFELHENQLDTNNAAQLAQTLSQLKSLTHLNLIGQDVLLSSRGAADITAAFGRLSQLKELGLEYGRITKKILSFLCPSISRMLGLKKLYIRWNHKESKDFICLLQVISQLPELESLYIVGKLTQEEVAFLSGFLPKMKKIRSLGIRGAFGAEGLLSLAPALLQMKELRALDLSECHLGPQSLGALEELLKRLPFLVHMGLADNQLGVFGVYHLSSLIRELQLPLEVNLLGN